MLDLYKMLRSLSFIIYNENNIIYISIKKSELISKSYLKRKYTFKSYLKW
jgi:hypothetical protein